MVVVVTINALVLQAIDGAHGIVLLYALVDG